MRAGSAARRKAKDHSAGRERERGAGQVVLHRESEKREALLSSPLHLNVVGFEKR